MKIRASGERQSIWPGLSPGRASIRFKHRDLERRQQPRPSRGHIRRHNRAGLRRMIVFMQCAAIREEQLTTI